MQKLKEYKYIIVIGLIILGIAFYWFQIRPSQIIKNCYQYVEERAYILEDSFVPGSANDINLLNKMEYEKCLKKHGLDTNLND